MKNITEIKDYMVNKYFYLATVNANGEPSLRPFGAIEEIEGSLYICTNSEKEVSKEMKNNPKIQIAITEKKIMEWLRISADAYLDESEKRKEIMFSSFPAIAEMYEEQKEIFEIFRLENILGRFYKSTGEIEEFKF